MRACVILWLVIAAAILGGGTRSLAGAPPPEELTATGTLTSIVRTPDSDSVRLEILTGCGLSLRVLKCVATPVTTHVSGKAGVVQPDDLHTGSILRVRYRPDKDGNVALAVEVVPPVVNR